MSLSRRHLLTGLLATAAGGAWLSRGRRGLRSAAAAPGVARRLIVYYFPDGVAGPAQGGMPSLWHLSGPERGFALNDQLAALMPFKDDCVFLNGLSMGPTDSGSHPGGAKKLLTAVDGGGGESIDRFLSRTAGASSPFRHVYLGAMAKQNGASGDKHISYPAAGVTVAPEDSPVQAMATLFGSQPMTGDPIESKAVQTSILDTALADLDELRGRLGSTEKAKLDLHTDALREVERRIQMLGSGMPPVGTCKNPVIDVAGIGDSAWYDPANFPKILRAQIDLMVQAMACGLSKVGVIQGSYHTSELIMSRFPATEMYDPGFDMRSHQASHYGPAHDRGKREFRDYFAQRRWWVAQFAYLLQQLKARPEDGGTMLDHSLVLLCTEVCDGNTHSHDNMPFILAGRAGGRMSTGRLLNYEGRRHADLLLSLAQAMGQGISGFGQGSSGGLPGLLS